MGAGRTADLFVHLLEHSLLLFIYFSLYSCIHSIWKFLSHSYGNTRFCNPLHQARDRTQASAAIQAAAVRFFFFNFFSLLAPHLRHMEVPNLGVKLELQLPVYTTATATQDPSHICDLHHSSWQCWIPDPLSKARDRTCILMDLSQSGSLTAEPRRKLLPHFCLLIIIDLLFEIPYSYIIFHSSHFFLFSFSFFFCTTQQI